MGPKVNRFRDIHLRSCAGILWVLHKTFEWCGNEFASFPQTLRYGRSCSATWKSTIRKCFVIQTTCLMCIAVGTTVEEVSVCHLRKRVVFGLHHESIQVPTSAVPSWVHLATAFMVPLSVHVILLTHYPLDKSYSIPYRTLSITHSNVFLVDHSISRIFTQQWICRNLFTFGPMLIGTFLHN